MKTIGQKIDDYTRAAARGLNDADHFDRINQEIKGFNDELNAYHRAGCHDNDRDDDDDDFKGVKNAGVNLERQTLPAPAMRCGPTRGRERDAFGVPIYKIDPHWPENLLNILYNIFRSFTPTPTTIGPQTVPVLPPWAVGGP